jgi:hypothetical protein
MTPNPKTRIMNEDQVPYQEASDYPRWTPSMREFLAGLEEFRQVIRGERN